jgi:acyl-CoA thioester hydrolase
MERSRTEYLRERGIDLAILHNQGIFFVVIDVHATYRAPAVYNDLLDVESTIIDFTSATVTFSTTIRNEADKLLVKGDVRLACTNKEGRASKIPENVRELLFSEPLV